MTLHWAARSELGSHPTDGVLADTISFHVSFTSFQSNAEHEIVEKIHASKEDNVSKILINPGAFTHTSISIRDALIGVGIPFYEIHISNIFAREEFRHKSYFSDIAEGVVCGMGTKGYEFALEKAINSN